MRKREFKQKSKPMKMATNKVCIRKKVVRQLRNHRKSIKTTQPEPNHHVACRNHRKGCFNKKERQSKTNNQHGIKASPSLGIKTT